MSMKWDLVGRSKISRTGIEPVTDGFQFYYSPPLYQLSYRESTLSSLKLHYYLTSDLALLIELS